REAENADPLRIDLPFVRARPNEPDRSTSILERRRVAITRREAIAKDEGRHAEGIEPFGDLFSFVIDGEKAVPSAGTDDDRGTVGLRRRRTVDRQRWLVRLLISDRAGGAVGPQPNELGRRS